MNFGRLSQDHVRHRWSYSLVRSYRTLVESAFLHSALDVIPLTQAFVFRSRR